MFSGEYSVRKLTEVPYDCWVIEGLFVSERLDRILADWPDPSEARWGTTRTHIGAAPNLLEHDIRVISKAEKMPDAAAEFFDALHQPAFAGLIGNIVGRTDLVADQTRNWSGLLHMRPGSFQLIHSDALRHPQLSVRKEFTVLIYLNRNWTLADRGELELWQDDMTARAAAVAPIFNRTVVFACGEASYHGVPEVKADRRAITLSLVSPLADGQGDDLRRRALFKQRPSDGHQVGQQALERFLVK